MEYVNLESVVQQTITRFKHNRSGEKPLVFVSVSPSIAAIAWNDGSLKEFVRLFVYECLHSSEPDKAIEMLLTRRSEIGDINDFSTSVPLTGCNSGYRGADSNITNA